MPDDRKPEGPTQPSERRRGGQPFKEDTIQAVIRDPNSVYVYWKVGGPRSEEATRELGPRAEWVLRVLDLTLSSSKSIAVQPDAGSAYVEVAPGHAYGFELACRAGAKWRTVCRSDRLEIPSLKRGPEGGRPATAVEKLRQPPGRDVPGLRYETTLPFLATSPGPAPPEEPTDQ